MYIRHWVLGLGCLLATIAVAAAGIAAPTVFGTYYFPDKPFPQFMHLWQEGWSLANAEGETVSAAKPDMPLGGYVFVYFQNASDQPIKVTDITLGGVKLSEGLGKSNDAIHGLHGSSVLLSKLPKEQVATLYAAGQPIWWKAEPREVPAKRTGQIVIRLKRDPKAQRLSVGILTDQGQAQAQVDVGQPQPLARLNEPRFASIAFSPNLDKVYLYLRHPKGGMRPDRLFVDGANVTQACEIAADESVDTSVTVFTPPQPIEMMSYHCFRAGYPDGSAATAGLHAWGSDMVYGMWGDRGDPRKFLPEWARHNINAQMGHANKETTHLSLKGDGFDFLQSLGMRQMATWQGNARRPLFYFLQDEPDAQDYGIDDLQPLDRLGCLGQALIEKAGQLRAKDAKTPILLNIDSTYKPENWYTYHQLSDIPCIDPYYPEQISSCYTKYPSRLPSHTKPTYVYAAAAISFSAAAPKPIHVILCSTRYPKEGFQARFPTPEEKRIEVYYALAAGAKGLSYWWFSTEDGLGANDPTARALYREIGLLGSEVRTAGPVVTVGSPAAVPVVKAPRLLMVRSLLSGTDTMAITCVNENVLCDRVGTVFRPLEKASLKMRMPSWLRPAEVFEITSQGTKDVTWKQEGPNLALELGTVNLTRFIIATSNASLRSELQKLYQTKFAANTAALMAGEGK